MSPHINAVTATPPLPVNTDRSPAALGDKLEDVADNIAVEAIIACDKNCVFGRVVSRTAVGNDGARSPLRDSAPTKADRRRE